MKSKSQQTFPKFFRELFRLPLPNGGFTLIEILVVVLIIGILGAIALPQYQRAVLKSRFAALMPIAKSMADSNEAFYLEHGEYADNAEDLPVQGRRNYTDGTELEFGTLTGYSYVLATRDNDFPNNYVVYQKHSENFPGEIHCEANANDTKAQDVCKSFGPTQELGETLTPNYLTYVLFGTGNGEPPTGDEGENNEENDTGDDNSSGTSGLSTDPEPQTPQCQEPTSAELSALQSTAQTNSGNNNLTVTAQCVNEQLKYEWSGGAKYTENLSGCTGDTAYQCVGAVFSGDMAYCEGNQENSCLGATFSGLWSECRGNKAYSCANTLINGPKSSCYGNVANACSGAVVTAGGRCMSSVDGGCANVRYGGHPNYPDNSNYIGCCGGDSCPTGTPDCSPFNYVTDKKVYNIHQWHGSCCNPSYMISGTCPNGVSVCS